MTPGATDHAPTRDALPPVPLWSPSPGELEASAMARFARYAAKKSGLDLRDYQQLWAWSVDDLALFWGCVWDYFGLTGVFGEHGAVLPEDQMPGAVWFPDVTLNFAEYLLRQGAPGDVAVVGADETGATATLTRADLRAQVASLASVLSDRGVVAGDVVVGYLPNIPEAVTAFLAVATLGATWSSVGQDYAPSAVVDRLGQLRPKVLVTADGYRFNGHWHPRAAAVQEIASRMDSIQGVVIVRRAQESDDHAVQGDPDSWIDWGTATTRSVAVQPVRVPFDHPLWVLFSSGTTGLPKGLVHGHGGILLESLKQMGLHWNLGPSDRLFWFTSPSWVMWNLQMSTLIQGGSIVCFDGSPTFPDEAAMWKLVADLGVTFFGTSPGYLQASQSAGLEPGRQLDLSRLRAMGSTGSPLPAHSHEWASRAVAPIPLWSVSGGTDVAGAFVGGAPLVPVWPGELSARCLGVAIEAWESQGRPVIGQVAEMVITKPMPSMPVFLWDDHDYTRYRAAYFSVFDGVWRQGDWITVTERGSVVIHGRSDSTLNRNGVRMGSADIYAAVDLVDEVEEALVIGVEQPDGGYWMPLFVVMRAGAQLTPGVREKIKRSIVDTASPRHVPDEIIEVTGIPRTRTGKKLEVPVKRLLQGAELSAVANPDTLDDPAVLAQYVAVAKSREQA
jgi:acetoacetyl-CoA synthetase